MEEFRTFYSKLERYTYFDRNFYFDIFDYPNGGTSFVHILPWTAIGAYLLMLVVLPPLLGGKKRKYNTGLWNVFLAVLSFFMMTGIGIPLGFHFYDHGYKETICLEGNGEPTDKRALFVPSGLMTWGLMFVFSKYFELYDTFALIIKNPNRKLFQMPYFLHWYHHTTVLLFCWYSTYYLIPSSFIFASVNAFVHSVMYTYYALVEFYPGWRPWWGKYVTLIQLSQMVVGLVINFSYFKYWYEGSNCAGFAPGLMLTCCALMYLSYFLLFLQMALNRWVFKSKVYAHKLSKKD